MVVVKDIIVVGFMEMVIKMVVVKAITVMGFIDMVVKKYYCDGF